MEVVAERLPTKTRSPSRFSTCLREPIDSPEPDLHRQVFPVGDDHISFRRAVFFRHCQDIGGELDQVAVEQAGSRDLVLLVHHQPPCFMLPEFLQP